jgi:NADPH:quinone reductase-like Zn-dependent oxidoreductase
MRAIVRQEYGGPDELVIQELAIPEPKPSHVVIQVKAQAGARVIATTRNRDRYSILERLGTHRVDLEEPELPRRIRESFPGGVDAVLELVGNSTILNSHAMVLESLVPRFDGSGAVGGWLSCAS